ncbi:MAG: Rieske (2Fe-2S) protein [Reinekea sp.]
MTELCAVSDLNEGSSIGFHSHRGPVFIVFYDGQIHIYKNRCPHRETNLEFLENQFLDDEGQLIQCSMHGALFEIKTGRCLSGPCRGDSLSKLDFKIQNGKIILL